MCAAENVQVLTCNFESCNRVNVSPGPGWAGSLSRRGIGPGAGDQQLGDERLGVYVAGIAPVDGCH